VLAVAILMWYVLEFTAMGRHCYATGSNAVAARLVGLRVDRIVFGSLMCSAFFGALAGVVLAARLGSSSYDIGTPYLLPAFSAVFLGATQVKPGHVNVVGTLIAVFLLATGIKGLQLVGAQTYVSNIFYGAALILAVALSVRGRRAAERPMKPSS
jgi:ribose transport system permease protein